MLHSVLAFALVPTQSPKPQQATNAPYYGSTLYALDERGFTPVCGLGRTTEIVLPLQSRSEAQPRVARSQRGVRVRIAAPSGSALAIDRLEFAWVEHETSVHVVTVSGSTGFRVLGDVRAPRSIVVAESEVGSRDELLPWYARQDGVVGPAAAILVHAPERDGGARLVVQAAEGRAGNPPILFVDGNGDTGEPQMALHGLPWEVDLVSRSRNVAEPTRLLTGAVDQISFAHVETVELHPIVATRALVGRVASWHREPSRVARMSWPVFDVREGELTVLELAAWRTSVERDDRTTWTIPAGSVAEIELPLPPADVEGKTSSLVIRVSSDAVDVIEPQPRTSTAGALFRDVAREAGIDMVHMEGPDLQLDIRPTAGPGAAWGDVDGDGWVDLFLPQGGGREGSRVPTAKMFRNKGDGTFVDVTKRANLELDGAGMGALFLDIDGDRDLDLFVANYGVNKLLLNDGKGRFRDVTTQVGVPQDSRWHAAVCAADYDKDGDLDLYVTSYLDYDPSKMPPAEELGRYQREDPLEMLPFAFPGEHKTLLRNDRVSSLPKEASAPVGAASAKDAAANSADSPSFHLTDVTDELKVGDPTGRGMQAIFWDFDRDGDQDLYVANDVSPNSFFRNEGDGRFKDISLATGLDDPRGCMGLSVGDIDGDGDEDLFITNWELESNALYVNNLNHTSSKSRVSTFRDQSVQAGLAQLSIGTTGWGCELADFDLDGDLDLFYANGYTSPDYESTGICVGQPCHYFENDGTGKFVPAFEKAGADVALPLAARCALACDYDQDGDLDLVVTANNGRVRLLRNETPRGKSWLGVRLRGKDGNTFAIGAEVRVKLGERVLLRSLRAGTSYLGGNAPELHFGLGDAKTIDELVVRWPDGRETKHAIERVNAFVTLSEPE